MTRINLLACATAWGLIGLTSYYPLPLWAQSSRLVNNRVQPSLMPLQLAQQDSSDTDFSGDGRSGNRAGGGSRSDCPLINPSLTALMPLSNSGTTVAERPTFWFYVPYSPEQAPVGEFVLQDENRKDLYRIPFTLPDTPGFVSFKVPSNQNPLEIGKEYRWYFNLYCDRHQSSSPIFVQGWVKRIAFTPALEHQLKAAKPREDEVYTANQIWFDAIAHLANLRLTNPTDAALDRGWSKLLGAKGVDLEVPNQAPIVGGVMLRLTSR